MITVTPGGALAPLDAPLDTLIAERFATRLFRSDASLWGPDAEAEAAIRLGWLGVFDRGEALVADALRLRDELREAGIDRIVLSGMGGSSLAPEVITRRDRAPLTVLDSTHPDQVRAAMDDLGRTALVVSSKSGSTVETRSHLAAFEAAFREAGIDPAPRIVVVTDPGSALQADAESAGYRVFLADPNVGGRYSALTAFGLVPSVLAGADGSRLLTEARGAWDSLRRDAPDNPGLRLAAALAAQLPGSYIFGVTERGADASQLADWIEQLLAESSGKHGRGVLPIALPEEASELRVLAGGGELPRAMFVVELASGSDEQPPRERTIGVSGPLGAQLLLWEVATVALCRLIGVNPFDQPDVESAKVAARAALAESAREDAVAAGGSLGGPELLDSLRAAVGPDDFVAIQAFLDRAGDAPLGELRDRLFDALGVPVSLGFGPRYLHSTGQFHKGGPERGVYLQVIESRVPDLPIPGLNAGFAELIRAQARGDRQVLEEHGRPVFTVEPAEIEALLDGR